MNEPRLNYFLIFEKVKRRSTFLLHSILTLNPAVRLHSSATIRMECVVWRPMDNASNTNRYSPNQVCCSWYGKLPQHVLDHGQCSTIWSPQKYPHAWQRLRQFSPLLLVRFPVHFHTSVPCQNADSQRQSHALLLHRLRHRVTEWKNIIKSGKKNNCKCVFWMHQKWKIKCILTS